METVRHSLNEFFAGKEPARIVLEVSGILVGLFTAGEVVKNRHGESWHMINV
jgi:hypothetical protein